MPRNNFAKLLLVVVLTFSAQLASAFTLITVEVGTCKPHLPTYASISAALAADPAPSIVEVCPGTYNEQIEITRPVILEGISSGNSAQAIIEPPAGGLTTNASDGIMIAAQIWVNNAVGRVDITDITVDGSGNGVTGSFVVGIFYQNSGGTLKRVATRNQQNDFFGYGIWLEGGSSNPSVTVENSSIHNAPGGIELDTADATPSELTATIKGNDVKTGIYGIFTSAASATITNNFISAGTGIAIGSLVGAGSISNNTFVGNQEGVEVASDGLSVTNNNILNSASTGIFVLAPAVIRGNSITNSPIGIEFFCRGDENVQSNTITDVGTALADVPSGNTTTNSYFNVGVIRTGGCE